EDENTERIKEALWSFEAESVMKHEGTGLKVCDHEHDGNELQTTPEFRSHVAKKLGVMLDSVICEVFSESPDCKPDTQDEDEERRQEDERTDAGARDRESAEPKKKKKKKKRKAVTERKEDETLAQDHSAENNTLKKRKKKEKKVNE
ncbi:hypothetical protein HF521_006538, partial [Silurus meridionalis]